MKMSDGSAPVTGTGRGAAPTEHDESFLHRASAGVLHPGGDRERTSSKTCMFYSTNRDILCTDTAFDGP